MYCFEGGEKKKRNRWGEGEKGRGERKREAIYFILLEARKRRIEICEEEKGGEGGEGQGRRSNLFSTIILEPRHLKRIRCRGGGR